MRLVSVAEIRQQLGGDRVLEPPGALPQPAERLDPSPPVRPHEIEIAAERLCLDSTSFRDIHRRADGEAGAIADRIVEIVGARGKMHNPETDSGGVLLGTVTAVGERYASPPAVGERIVTLASLTMTPLRLEAVTGLDPDSPQAEVTGTAYLCERGAWATLPDDLPVAKAVDVLDVCAAASQTRALVAGAGTVCVLGAGHAGKLVLAAAREATSGGTLVAVDVEAAAVERVVDLGLCDVGVTADLRDPLGALEAVRAAGVPPADLTVVVVNASGCEQTALLLTAESGAVLFFSMATRFAAAALAADGVGSGVRMLIGGGYSVDGGAYAMELVRRSPALRRALGVADRERV
jgi:L-erythro-3,5-diaminohexanoate dehydrogenase